MGCRYGDPHPEILAEDATQWCGEVARVEPRKLSGKIVCKMPTVPASLKIPVRLHRGSVSPETRSKDSSTAETEWVGLLVELLNTN